MQRRIINEYNALSNDDKKFYSIKCENDMLIWYAILIGPQCTPYFNGKYSIKISIPNTYPLKPPIIQFQTNIHNKMVNNQNYVIGFLKTHWAPYITIIKAIHHIYYVCFYLAGDYSKLSQIVDMDRYYIENVNDFLTTALEMNKIHANGVGTDYYIIPQISKDDYKVYCKFIKTYCWSYCMGMKSTFMMLDINVTGLILKYFGDIHMCCDLYNYPNKYMDQLKYNSDVYMFNYGMPPKTNKLYPSNERTLEIKILNIHYWGYDTKYAQKVC